MNKKIDNKRVGFHSIESIIKNNPHKIKKLFIPQSREDKRIINLISLAEKNGIKYQVLKKLKQEPEAEILNENNIKCFSVSSVEKGVKALEKYNDDYAKIIFGSHYIAEEVYTATGKHFDTTNN